MEVYIETYDRNITINPPYPANYVYRIVLRVPDGPVLKSQDYNTMDEAKAELEKLKVYAYTKEN